MKRVILESPYGNSDPAKVLENVLFARLCVRDCILRGEAPIASHLLYTQSTILRDDIPMERALGITAGLIWRSVADYSVFYTDNGWSPGMLSALESALEECHPFYIRGLLALPKTPNNSYTLDDHIQFGSPITEPSL